MLPVFEAVPVTVLQRTTTLFQEALSSCAAESQVLLLLQVCS